MRLSILALMLAVGLAPAGAAAAQAMTMGMGQSSMGAHGPGLNPYEPYALDHVETPQERYARELGRLRRKMLRITAEDGGQLSEAHKAALQAELDAINRTYAANSASAAKARR